MRASWLNMLKILVIFLSLVFYSSCDNSAKVKQLSGGDSLAVYDDDVSSDPDLEKGENAPNHDVAISDSRVAEKEIDDEDDSSEDVCDGISCSAHGFCFDDKGEAACQCDDGYHAVEVYCLKDDDPDKCNNIDCSGHGP